MSSFQWVWRHSCLNVTHKTPYRRYEGKTNDLLIVFIGYVNDLNKLRQFKLSVQKSHHRLQCTFRLLTIVRVALLRSSWPSCFRRAALFIVRATNSSLVFTFSFFSSIPQDKNRICTRQLQTAVSPHPLKIGHVFIWNYLLGIVYTTTS